MKILVMSMLRLGDVILAAPVLKGLKRTHPNCELHLLINQQFANVTQLIPFVDQVKLFDRESMQYELARADASFFSAYDRFWSLKEELNAEKYDLLINLTHNRLSGHLAELITADEKIGLVIDSQNRSQFGSNWIRFLNHYIAGGGKDVFHYIDIFRFAVDPSMSDAEIMLMESEAGEQEAKKFVQDGRRFILVQPFTSDTKKDWDSRQLLRCLTLFSRVYSEVSVGLLGAPNEESRIHLLEGELKSRGVSCFSAITSLEGAFSLMQRAELLLTGDTSIKHLACAARAPIIELSLGSSDYRKTGAYKAGSLILQPKVGCAPCVHSQKCSQISHLCGEQLSSELVALVMGSVLEGRGEQLKELAIEYQDEVEILRTAISQSGFWHATSVIDDLDERTLNQWLNLSSWKLFLQNEYKKPIGRYGSEGFKLKTTLDRLFPKSRPLDWMQSLDEVERNTQNVEKSVDKVILHLKRALKRAQHPEAWQEFVESVADGSFDTEGWVETHALQLSQNIMRHPENNFVQIRKLQDSIFELHHRTQIKMKIIRSLRTQIAQQGEK